MSRTAVERFWPDARPPCSHAPSKTHADQKPPKQTQQGRRKEQETRAAQQTQAARRSVAQGKPDLAQLPTSRVSICTLSQNGYGSGSKLLRTFFWCLYRKRCRHSCLPEKIIFESSKMSFLDPGSVAQRRFTTVVEDITARKIIFSPHPKHIRLTWHLPSHSPAQPHSLPQLPSSSSSPSPPSNHSNTCSIICTHAASWNETSSTMSSFEPRR